MVPEAVGWSAGWSVVVIKSWALRFRHAGTWVVASAVKPAVAEALEDGCALGTTASTARHATDCSE